MCGRVNVSDHEGIQEFLEELGIPLIPVQAEPRFNTAPGQPLPMLDAQCQFLTSDWGLEAAWSGKGGRPARLLINARSETAWEKPSFRRLMAGTRAVILVNGYYEWQRRPEGKTPYYFSPLEGRVLPLAGIYQASAGTIRSCILTRAASETIAHIHDRMPVILPRDAIGDWLQGAGPATQQAALDRAEQVVLRLWPVSEFVNNARNEGPACVEPTGAGNEFKRPDP